MKISYNWLRELVDSELSPRELAEKLTMVGLAVDAVEVCGDDHVLEFDLTSNRPDCLSHLGVAREAAAVCGKPFRMPAVEMKLASQKTSALATVEIAAPDLCPRYTARLIRGVKVGPSPDWLVRRLEAMGQRSVNNIADITNYVMLEMGQPLHAFDLARLGGARIIVRTARPGETMTTLDAEARTLTDRMLVIADAERPVALAGIKGGEDSGITADTVDVLLEAAYFAPAQVRATSAALGLATEASYRFERGTDPEIVPAASDRAAAMIAQLAGGEVLGDLVDVYPRKTARTPIRFRPARYEALTGLTNEPGEPERILRSLGMTVESGAESLHVTAPSWRTDIAIEEDLIEEVARIAGYDRLTNRLPGSAGAGAYLPGERRRRAARGVLAALGYSEAINFSFVNAEADKLAAGVPDAGRMRLRNPIDENRDVLRTTLVGGLLDCVARNFNHATRNLRLFEIGVCFRHVESERPDESERLTLAATGARNEHDWQAASVRMDFYDLKGAVEAVCAAMGLRQPAFKTETAIEALHPGRSASIWLDAQPVGEIGQVHPRVAAHYKFKQPVFVAELNLSRLLLADADEVRYHPLAKFPTVVRDIAVLLDTSVEYGEIERAVMAAEIPTLLGVRLFDRYTGGELPEGKHSLALSLRYRAEDRTLTDEEIAAAHEQVSRLLQARFRAEIR
jgi:phenylalanyl-tRNA synthetase beta chain